MSQDVYAQQGAVLTSNAAAGHSQTIPSDTAAISRDSSYGLRWMIRGRRDWSHYFSPGMCLSAMEGIDNTRWRRRALIDTARAYGVGDTLAKAAIDAGRTCLARFTPAQVKISELSHLRDLAIAVGDSATARAAITRLVAQAPDTIRKLLLLEDGIRALLLARRDYTPTANTLRQAMTRYGRLGELRALSVDAVAERARLSRLPFDSTELLRSATARRTNMAALHPRRTEMRSLFATTIDYDSLGTYGRDALDYSSALFTVEAFRHTFDREGEADSLINRVTAWYTEIWNLDPDTAIEKYAGPASTRKFYSQGMDVAEHLVTYPAPDFWFEPGDTTAHLSPVKTLSGIPGKVTVLLPVSREWGANAAVVAQYLRFYHKYKDSGLAIILVDSLVGRIFSSATLAPRSEADLSAWYFHTYLRLPWPLAVYRQGVGMIPQILGRDGRRLLPVEALYPQTEPVLEAVIRRALGLSIDASDK